MSTYLRSCFRWDSAHRRGRLLVGVCCAACGDEAAFTGVSWDRRREELNQLESNGWGVVWFGAPFYTASWVCAECRHSGRQPKVSA